MAVSIKLANPASIDWSIQGNNGVARHGIVPIFYIAGLANHVQN